MKSLFEEHGGKYIQCGDYLIPDLGLTEQEQKPLGKYGMMRRKYLEENRSIGSDMAEKRRRTNLRGLSNEGLYISTRMELVLPNQFCAFINNYFSERNSTNHTRLKNILHICIFTKQFIFPLIIVSGACFLV